MRSTWAIAALALVLAACGSAQPNRLDLTTPGATTGSGVPAATSAPLPSGTPEATPTATPEKDRVTAIEKRVIKGWSESLRAGRVAAAARYFSVPTQVYRPNWKRLMSVAAIERFNRGQKCGSKLLRMRRGTDGFVVAIFRLVERRGAGAHCGAVVGDTAAVAFLIQDQHIQQWVRVDVAEVEPTPTPTAVPTARATPRSS